MTTPLPRLSVVVATLRRPARLEQALRSLQASTLAPHEVVVVDGDDARSAAPVVDRLAGQCAFPVLHLPAPRGGTVQRNLGTAAATGDVVVYLDDDARVTPDALALLARAFHDEGVVGAAGRVVEPASNAVGGKTSRVRGLLAGGGRDGTFTRFGYPRRLRREDLDHDVEFMQGCFMAARTGLARSVGFDENLAEYSLAEDEDFSYRLSRHGRLRYLADAVVHHDNAGFGSRDRRAFGRLVVRNRTYLFRKNFAQTPLSRLQFRLLLVLLVVHRLANRDVEGARGIVEAVARPARLPVPQRSAA